MKKKELKNLALMGITGGIIMAANSPLNAHESLTNISTENYLAASCGGKGSCGGVTAYNGRGGCNAYQDPSNQQGNFPQSQHGCGNQSSYQNQGNWNGQGNYNQHSCNGKNQSNQWGNNNNSGQRYYPTYFADSDDQATRDSDSDSKPMTEAEFKAKLSTQGKADFDKLSPEGKANAVKMASHDCSGKNDCKGQNSCKSDKNSCAGQGGCKGQSKCATTPEQAVKISSMKDKRTSLNSSTSTNSYR